MSETLKRIYKSNSDRTTNDSLKRKASIRRGGWKPRPSLIRRPGTHVEDTVGYTIAQFKEQAMQIKLPGLTCSQTTSWTRSFKESFSAVLHYAVI